ncbi:MAG: hypothetical protein ABF624_00035 [Liquorilactobacillus ghanensis]|uniref:hypothetical protein n=1 Tax=Liquorilactobacillus ghanensis TaxID=399370 RepID=UPI0039EBEB50
MSKKKVNTDKRLPFDRRMKNLEVTALLTTQKKTSKGIQARSRRVLFRKKEYEDLIDDNWWKDLVDDGEIVTSITFLR